MMSPQAARDGAREAIETVLLAERAAQQAIDEAQVQAQALVASATEQVAGIRAHTEARLRRIHESCAAALESGRARAGIARRNRGERCTAARARTPPRARVRGARPAAHRDELADGA
ncbi:MAG: hypothetical protein U1F11_12010 [Steroidobacteraceae bacterium]